VRKNMNSQMPLINTIQQKKMVREPR